MKALRRLFHIHRVYCQATLVPSPPWDGPDVEQACRCGARRFAYRSNPFNFPVSRWVSP